MMKKLLSIGLGIISTVAFAVEMPIPDNFDISGSANGVIAMPANAPDVIKNSGFVKYSKIQAPNGKAIHFIAQDSISEAQIVRARNILLFYLTNYAGSQYGSDKTAVINAMGTNESILMLLNGSDLGNGSAPELPAQTLYANELPVEGSAWYINNNYEHRDAGWEEILHLFHDNGIGVDEANGTPSAKGALPAYQTEIRAGQVNGLANSLWGINVAPWIAELTAENSLSQEYLASVIDSYYGLWGPWTESTTHGMWGLYISKTRAEIETEDPMGWAIIPKFFSPFIHINMDVDPSFSAVFLMHYNASYPYTHKSQYLQHCTLTGSLHASISGNDEWNRLIGDASDNGLTGGKGNDYLDGGGNAFFGDTAKFSGNHADYTIAPNGSTVIVTDNTPGRDGIDTLVNIELLVFKDKFVANVATSVKEASTVNVFGAYPNPADDVINIVLADEISKATLTIVNQAGQVVITQTVSNNAAVNVADLTSGVYHLQVVSSAGTSSATVFIK